MKLRNLAIPLSIFLAATTYGDEISFPLNSDKCHMISGTEKATFEGYEFLTEHSGRPKVPGFTYTFLLPPDADLASVTVSIENEDITHIRNRVTVEKGTGYANALQNLPEDKSQQMRSGFYPESFARVLTTGTLGNCKLVTCRFTPFQQDTTTKEFRKLNSGTMKLNYSLGGETQGSTILPWKVKDLKRFTENFSEMSSSYEIPQLGEEPHMVILTTNATVSGSSELANYIQSKEDNGFKISLITEDQWGGSNWDKADDIRQWLQSNYEQEQISYLLLIGDPTPTEGDVPMKMTLPMATPIGNDCPTDYYYAELTGNWDLNGNAWCGEGSLDLGVGGCENFPEISVGRIPVYNSDYATLDNILKKTIAYTEADSNSIEWRENILMPVEPSDFMTPAYQFAEAIKADFADPLGWGTFRIYAESYGDTIPDLSPTTIENVTKSWQENPYGACVWKTHGNEDLAKKIMDSEHAKLLNDEYPSLIFQGSCLNGKPEDANNLGYALLKNGAIATISSTRLSLYKMGQTDPRDIKMTNLGMCYYFGQYIIQDKLAIGDALNRLKTEIDGDFRGLWLNYCDYNVYGDPTVGIESSKGHSVAALHESDVPSMHIGQNRKGITLHVGNLNVTKAEVTILSVKGQIVSSRKLSLKSDSFSISKKDFNLAQGLYIVQARLQSADGKSYSISKPMVSF